jgi:hypothetical protein
MNHLDPLYIQGIIICAIGGLLYGILMIVLFLKAGGRGMFQSNGKSRTKQADQYWLEEDGQPSRQGPGKAVQSVSIKPNESGTDNLAPDEGIKTGENSNTTKRPS